MFVAIVSRTPVWVWVLLVALVALGLTQTRTRLVTPVRATVLPVVMMGLSLFGVLSTFGAKPWPIGAWLGALVATTLVAEALGAWRGTTWSVAASMFKVPGSWLPMVVIMSIFAVKFYVGVRVAMQPELKQAAHFSLIVCLVYGVFSGLFLARGVTFWTLLRNARPH